MSSFSAIMCSAADDLENGKVSLKIGSIAVPKNTVGATVDSVATFICSRGYDLSGKVASTCQVDGTWSSTFPTCEKGEKWLRLQLEKVLCVRWNFAASIKSSDSDQLYNSVPHGSSFDCSRDLHISRLPSTCLETWHLNCTTSFLEQLL